jgi:hypothetical protein
MIASKVICNDTYSNKTWSVVAQGMFGLREINQMVREMCNYLEQRCESRRIDICHPIPKPNAKTHPIPMSGL